MLEAKDLAKCDLSNYLTERLDSVLERDRALRAERDGCPLEAVSLCNSLPCMACCWGTSGFPEAPGNHMHLCGRPAMVPKASALCPA